MIVGVPKEVKTDEYRVAITPAGVRELTTAGHTVYVEQGAGVGSSIPDDEFIATGAKIVADPDDIWAESDMVLGVKEPVPEEYPRLGLRNGPGPLHLPPPGRLAARAPRPCWPRATPPSPTRRCAWPTARCPLLTPMSEVAGRMAPLMGAHHLMRPGGGRGVLVCGVPGVRSRQGGHPRRRGGRHGRGHPGRRACTADVYILDRNLERLRQVDHHFRGALETVASSTHAIEETLPRRRHRDRRRPGGRGQGAQAGLRRAGGPDARTARCWWTSRWTRAAASSRPAPPPTPTRPSRSTARSSTAWPTCPAPCPTPRPTPWSTPPCPTCWRSPTTAGATRCGTTPPWPKGSTWSRARWSTSRWPRPTA